jgi:hypothetical protein
VGWLNATAVRLAEEELRSVRLVVGCGNERQDERQDVQEEKKKKKERRGKVGPARPNNVLHQQPANKPACVNNSDTRAFSLLEASGDVV